MPLTLVGAEVAAAARMRGGARPWPLLVLALLLSAGGSAAQTVVTGTGFTQDSNTAGPYPQCDSAYS